MNKIAKFVGLGAAIAMAGTIGWQASAQMPMEGGPQGMGHGMVMGMGHGHGHMAGGFADSAAAHLAQFKTALDITPQQQPAWDAYARAMGEIASTMKASHDGMDMTKMHSMSDQDRQAFMTQMQARHETAFQSAKVAADQLLPALTDAQQAKAKEILPGLAAHGPGMMHHAGMRWHAAPPSDTPR